MHQRSLFRYVRLFTRHNIFTRSLPDRKSSNCSIYSFGEPELDLKYITDPVNREEIEENIKARKEHADLGSVIELNEQLQSEHNLSKKRELWESLLTEARKIPNRLHPDVKGYGEEAKVIKTTVHMRPEIEAKEFHELTKFLNSARLKGLTTVAGPESYYFYGELAELEQALIKYALSQIVIKNFKIVSVPDILPSDLLDRCGMRTKGKRSQVFFLEDAHGEDICLSGTSEVALAGLVSNHIYDVKKLPILMTAVSRCYRAEVSELQEEKGIYRVHQFTKVEMFAVTHPDKSDEMLNQFVETQEKIFSSLGLDYQLLDMPASDLGPSAYRKFDIEAWMPGRKIHGELSSSSNCTDYQARRLNIKCKDGEDVFYAHTVNGTACAIPRTIIAFLETHQRPDFKINVPASLQRYFDWKEEIDRCRGFPKLKLYSNRYKFT